MDVTTELYRVNIGGQIAYEENIFDGKHFYSGLNIDTMTKCNKLKIIKYIQTQYDNVKFKEVLNKTYIPLVDEAGYLVGTAFRLPTLKN